MQNSGLQNTAVATPQSGYLNGIIPFANNAALDATAKAQTADEVNNQPVIRGLAAHVRTVWERNWRAKRDIEERMLRSMRQRRGEYDPDELAEIRQSGGTEIYMMLSANKARAASAWIKDTLLGSGDDKPWTITPGSIPDVSPQIIEQVTQETYHECLMLAQTLGQGAITPQLVRDVALRVKNRTIVKTRELAKQAAANMEDKMEDQLQEGNFINALSEFIDDLCTFPSAIMRGPVVRKKPKITWVKTGNDYEIQVTDVMVKEFERVDPFMIYPTPAATNTNDPGLIHRHRLTRSDLASMKGVEGYNDEAIDKVLEEYGRGGLHEWLMIDTEKAKVEGKSTFYTMDNPEGLIDALQLFDSVQGQMLIDWGMDAEQVPDPLKEYSCEVWLIGSWVIKATLNYDPLNRTNYYKASYEEIPGAFWGNSPMDLIRDCQTVCNAAARALVNNMGIASGPQVEVNVSRLPTGEDITEMYPWKIWQTKSDPYGTTSMPAVNFFQPNLLAGELMGVYEKFAQLADEYSSIPKYIAGDPSASNAGRTASGLSMLMSNAGKGVKQVIANLDKNVIEPAIQRLYEHNMKYETDPTLKGDVNIVAKGADGLVLKDSITQRRNEFMQIALNSPVVQQVVGVNGVAALLREGVKNLDMDSEELVPSKEELQVQQMQQSQMMSMQQPQQQKQGPVSQSGQSLMDGSPVTDNFSPMGR